MEEIIVLTIVFGSIGLLVLKMTKIFKDKYPCGACPSRKRCARSKNCSFLYLGRQKRKQI